MDQMNQDMEKQYDTENETANPLNHDDQNKQEPTENRPDQEKKKKNLRQLFIAVAAGVAGSAFTLAASPFVENFYAQESQQGAYVKTAGTTSTVNTKQVSASDTSASDMVEQSSKAIVGIVNMQQNQSRNPLASPDTDSESEAGTGSGVIYKLENGTAYIVTNNHVIEGASNIQVSLPNGKTVDGKLVGKDALTDIAVLKVKTEGKNLTALQFGNSESLRAGDKVWAIGNPLGLDLSRTVTEGIISAVNRTITTSTSAGEWDLDVIQTDAAINPGNSGGALMNSSGQVIGINSLKIQDSGAEGLGFAIPSNNVVSIINQITKNGEVKRPYLGVGVKSVEEIPPYYLDESQDDETDGVMVLSVDANSPAGKAGLEVKDIIKKIDGETISSEAGLRKFLYTKAKIGNKITIEYVRGGKSHKTSVTLAENHAANS